jgi:hypothetical protein
MPESLRPISNQVPSAMLESERHNEIAKILAGGLIRLQGLAPALQKSNAPSKRSPSQSKPPNNSVAIKNHKLVTNFSCQFSAGISNR